ncbi:uncharacterized protein LOC143010652 isoform X2 [Genypterus blacodes]|uniref:uncharacterized protein LOC143010652 isoform X2 n=1 Tax=Genypterus blacodes TaxID=154954 RepID=UPI003F760FBC
MDGGSAEDAVLRRKLTLIARLKPCEKNEKRFTCINANKRNILEFPALKDYLPEGYDYHVCNYKTISESADHVNFRAAFRMALSTEDEIKLWLRLHRVTWRVDRTHPRKGQKVLFKVEFRCQHNTRPRGSEKAPSRSKNTNCPAKMTVTLLRTQVSRGRQSLHHNHNMDVADALRCRDMGDKTRGKLTKHQAAAIGFAEMCQELSAMIDSDSSFTASAVAAVKAFKKIKEDPSKVMAALRVFGRSTNTSLASVRSRRRVCLGERRRLATGRPAKVTAAPEHVNGHLAPVPHCRAHPVSEGKCHPK